MSSSVGLGGEESSVFQGLNTANHSHARIPAWSSRSIHCFSSQSHKVGIPAPIV